MDVPADFGLFSAIFEYLSKSKWIYSKNSQIQALRFPTISVIAVEKRFFLVYNGRYVGLQCSESVGYD